MKTKNLLKKLLLAALLLVMAGTVSYAQCDKTVTFKSAVTNYLNEKGAIERTKDEETVITITKTNITIIPGDEDHKLTGTLSSYTCNWPVPFKEGKSVIKSILAEGDHDLHVTITIEGKGGKVTLTFEAEEMPEKKIQVVATVFE